MTDTTGHEQNYALREGHQLAASDQYFGARPQIDGADRRKVFEAGFVRGWDATHALREAQRPAAQDDRAAFKRGDIVRKRSGSAWEGRVCGEYSTSLTPEGYAVESDKHPGSVQIYPAAALELIDRGQQAALASRLVPPPISDDYTLWSNDEVMSLNAELGLTMDQIVRFARAIIAARDAQWKGGV